MVPGVYLSSSEISGRSGEYANKTPLTAPATAATAKALMIKACRMNRRGFVGRVAFGMSISRNLMVHVETDSNPCLRRLSAAYEWAWNKNVTRAQESITVQCSSRGVAGAPRRRVDHRHGVPITLGTDLTSAIRLAAAASWHYTGAVSLAGGSRHGGGASTTT